VSLIRFNKHKIVDALLEKKMYVDYPNYHNETPLHYAARWGDLEMLNLLIKYGADVNGKTKSKETALHKCGRWDRKDAAIILLQLGADPSVKNSDGNKASHMTVDPELKFLLDNFSEYKEIIKTKVTKYMSS